MSITPNPPADFTPTQGTYKSLTPFRYWCQKVLPLVYDDSLSYYEVLCKVVDYLNKTMEDVDTLHTDVDNLHDAYVELQSYVNNYFSTLDVQEEINHKLDVMASDGTLSALVDPFVPPAVDDKIDRMVTSGELANVVSPFVPPAVSQKVDAMVDDGTFAGITNPQVVTATNSKINAMVTSGEFATITDPKVVTEVQAKVNSMVQDGSFGNITNPQVISATDTWLGQHITNPSNPPLDTSLTQNNAAAPAKTVGDKGYLWRGNLNSLPSTELSDYLELGSAGINGTLSATLTDLPSGFAGQYITVENIKGFTGDAYIQKVFTSSNADNPAIRIINTYDQTVGNWTYTRTISDSYLYKWNGYKTSYSGTKLSDYAVLGTTGFSSSVSATLTDLPSGYAGQTLTVENIKSFADNAIIQRVYITSEIDNPYTRIVSTSSTPYTAQGWLRVWEKSYKWIGAKSSLPSTSLSDFLELGTAGITGSLSATLIDLPSGYAGQYLTVENTKGFTGDAYIQKVFTSSNADNPAIRIINTSEHTVGQWKYTRTVNDNLLYKWNGYLTSFTGTALSNYITLGTTGISSAVSTTLTDLPSGYAGQTLTIENIKSFADNAIIQRVYTTNEIDNPYTRIIDISNSASYVVGSWKRESTITYKWRGDLSSLPSTSLSDYLELGTTGIKGSLTSSLIDLPTGYAGQYITVENIRSFTGDAYIQKVYTSSNIDNPMIRVLNVSEHSVGNWKSVLDSVPKFNGTINGTMYTGTTLAGFRLIGTSCLTSAVTSNLTDLPEDSYAGEYLTVVNELVLDGNWLIQRVYKNQDFYSPYFRRIYLTSGSITGWYMDGFFERNMKWCVIGDSWTQGDFSGGTTEYVKYGKYAGYKCTYPNLIASKENYNLVDLSVNGLRLGGSNGFAANSLSSIPADSDIITLAIGGNDDNNHQNTPIGTIDDNTTDTFYGAWNVTMKYIFEHCPTAHIGIIIENSYEYNAIDYVNAIIAIAKKWCVPYLNESNGEQVPTIMRSTKDPSTHSSVALTARNQAFIVSAQNTHPNGAAHRYRAIYIDAWIKTI